MTELEMNMHFGFSLLTSALVMSTAISILEFDFNPGDDDSFSFFYRVRKGEDNTGQYKKEK